jgi:TolB-like protein/DNA-binding winged helix-turn-helix (wHTH) protein/Tfp pilus assembly protein PilF
LIGSEFRSQGTEVVTVPTDRRWIRFGPYCADLRTCELTKLGTRLKLQARPFEILTMLLERPGEVVTREEIRARLWPNGTFVDFDNNISSAIRKVRDSLCDSAAAPRYVETVGRVGYRFIAAVDPPVRNVHPELSETARPESLHPQPTIKPAAHAPERTLWNHSWLILALVLGLAAVAVVAVYRSWLHKAVPARSAIQSIAVLPLQNFSGDPSQEYFADGMTDEITNALARLAGPSVISRTSAMHYKGTRKTVPEIARELHVGAIVEGSVDRFGDRVRVRVQLIEVSTDRHLWADEYDRQLSDVLQLEADVAQDLARQIELHLSQKQQERFRDARHVNPQAFQDYLLGRHYWSLRTIDTLNQAIQYFNRALQEDPADARSYAGLAQCYVILPFYSPTPQAEAYTKAQSAANSALALDDSLPEAHLATAEVKLYRDWDFKGAEKEFRTTLSLNPNYSTAHQWYGEFLITVERYQEAIQEAEAALALDPLSAIVHHQAAGIFAAAGQVDRSLEEFQEVQGLNPNFSSVYESRSWVYRFQGKYVESIHDLQLTVRDPRAIAVVNKLMPAYLSKGRAGYYRQCMKLHQIYPHPSFYLARDYLALGDRDAALTQLEQAYRNHDYESLWLLQTPDLRPLRSEPRFQQLVQAVGFPRQ